VAGAAGPGAPNRGRASQRPGSGAAGGADDTLLFSFWFFFFFSSKEESTSEHESEAQDFGFFSPSRMLDSKGRQRRDTRIIPRATTAEPLLCISAFKRRKQVLTHPRGARV